MAGDFLSQDEVDALLRGVCGPASALNEGFGPIEGELRSFYRNAERGDYAASEKGLTLSGLPVPVLVALGPAQPERASREMWMGALPKAAARDWAVRYGSSFPGLHPATGMHLLRASLEGFGGRGCGLSFRCEWVGAGVAAGAPLLLVAAECMEDSKASLRSAVEALASFGKRAFPGFGPSARKSMELPERESGAWLSMAAALAEESEIFSASVAGRVKAAEESFRL